MPDRLLGVVLCGGKSSRMGRDKATLELPGGQSYLERAVARLEPLCDQVLLSAKPGSYTAPPIIDDPEPSFGPISGVTESLRYAKQHHFQACLFTPVDTPDLTTDELALLIAAFHHAPNQAACAVTPDTATPDKPLIRIEPLIAVYPVSLLPTLLRCVKEQRYSLSRLLATIDVTTVVLDKASCRNVNHPNDITDPER